MHCWPITYRNGPALKQRWVRVSYSLGWDFLNFSFSRAWGPSAFITHAKGGYIFGHIVFFVCVFVRQQVMNGLKLLTEVSLAKKQSLKLCGWSGLKTGTLSVPFTVQNQLQ